MPLIAHTLRAAAAANCLDAVAIAAPEDRWEALRGLAHEAGFAEVRLSLGGERRQDSVAAALAGCAEDLVCVHDAARPLAPPRLFAGVLAAAEAEGAATTGVPCVDTIKRIADGHVVKTLERGELIATQTPQGFRRELLREAHAAAQRDQVAASDDSVLVERLGVAVAVVPGDERNRKVTHDSDLVWLRAVLEQR